MDTNNIKSEILTTKGIKSIVYENGILQKHKTLGHIGLYDFDGMSQDKVIESCIHEPGINALLESSINSHHVWNFSVKNIDQIALDGLRLGSDCKHVAHGYRAGRWVLRITSKEYEMGEIYKSAPKFITMWYNDSDYPQSIAHFRVLMANINLSYNARLKMKCSSYKWAGCDRATLDEYMTITDNVKKLIH